VAYLIFTGLNISGIKAAASFELIVTIIAVVGLLAFAGATLPAFKWENLEYNALPNGWTGAFAALPFAIWFFLGIEGVANVAEETIDPRRNVLIGFGSAILTLVLLCLLTFVAAVGVGGWERIVFPDAGGAASDSPLPLALAHVIGAAHPLYRVVTFIGLFGLIASFHGIILAAGRATFEFGRVGFAPAVLGRIHPKYKTPANALLLNGAIGIVAVWTGKTSEIITIACFGALTLYIVSMVALLVLRKNEPLLERPFRAPFYPWSTWIALVISAVALLAMTLYNLKLALFYFGLLLLAYIWFKSRKI
jgi:ethanolamine permease